MVNEITGKDTALVETTGAVVKRSKPVLVQLGQRLLPSDGRWHPDLCADYIRDHGGRDRMIPLGELARVFYGGNTPSNKQRIRRRLFQVWRRLLEQALLLVIHYDPRSNAALACKLYDPRSDQERTLLRDRLARMEKQKLLKTEQVERALQLADCLDLAHEETPA